MTVVAAGAMLYALTVLAPAPGPPQVTLLVTLGVLALTAELLSFLLPGGAKGSISFIPNTAAFLLVPNYTALLAIVLPRLVAEVSQRRPLQKKAFNVAQSIIAHCAAILAFRASGGVALSSYVHLGVAAATAAIIVPMLVAYIVAFSLNALLVNGVIALSSSRSIPSVWRETGLITLGLDLLAAPIVFTFAWLYACFGPMIATVVWIPLLGLRQLTTNNVELAQTNKELLELMVKSIEARDPYTSGHSRRVREYAIKIARLIGLSQRQIDEVGTAALLHDVGKIFDKYAPILAKEDRLTPAEWTMIKEHPIDGANLVATMTRLRSIVPAIRHHHESWDGSGYPDGLRGEEIPLASRIIMFADTVDAMTTERPYRGALGEEVVRAEIIKCRARQFDPAIADRILAVDFWSTMFPPADRVQRASGLMRLIAKS